MVNNYSLDHLNKKIVEWAADRDLLSADPHRQLNKLFEECGELAKAINHSDTDEIIDGIGDTTVVLIILSEQLGLKLQGCLNRAYDEIKDRKGKTINGMFVKND